MTAIATALRTCILIKLVDFATRLIARARVGIKIQSRCFLRDCKTEHMILCVILQVEAGIVRSIYTFQDAGD